VLPPVGGWVVCGGTVRAHMYGCHQLPTQQQGCACVSLGLESPEYCSCHGTNDALQEYRCVMLAWGIVRHGDVDVNARMKRVVIDFR
jgi:hypothetical protein